MALPHESTAAPKAPEAGQAVTEIASDKLSTDTDLSTRLLLLFRGLQRGGPHRSRIALGGRLILSSALRARPDGRFRRTGLTLSR